MRSPVFFLLVFTGLFCPIWGMADEVDMDFDSADFEDGDTSQDTEPIPMGQVQDDADYFTDTETVPDTTDTKADHSVDFIGLMAPPLWNSRNGLGVTMGIGGATCFRQYCDSTIDTKLFGSALGNLGAYYRHTPNLSLFADASVAYLNTNFSQILTQTPFPDKEGAFLFQFLLGARFHVPVKGWLDLYTGAGIGPIVMRAKAEIGSDVFRHRWAGLDIEINMGANFYFFSDGPMKNLSIGPFMRMGFPLWPRLCVEHFGGEECLKPSSHPTQNDYLWSDTPFMFHAGIEARYDFGIVLGKSTASLTSAPSTDTSDDTPPPGDTPADNHTSDDTPVEDTGVAASLEL